MKIIDVRDGFIKFEADKSIYLSSFVQVEGMSKNYIAQVNQFKTFGEISIASAKILFILENNELKNYDKTEPSRDAQITGFTPDILNNSINAKKPVIAGKTLNGECAVKIDASAFDKKMLISVDDKNINNLLVRNLSKQFENLGVKTVVLDTLGVIAADKKKAGSDFKLPLDTSSLAFMYESCLNDATSDSKSTIIEIFRDLSEYSKTVPFVPFAALKSIVDDMVDKQHIFKLLVLKNKLAKFEKLGYFASTQQEVDNLDRILDQNCAVIDLTGMDTLFQNRYLSYIYEKLDDTKVQVLLETANTVSKKNLKFVISDSKIPTTLITHSKYQYLNDIKNMFDNFIIEPTISNNAVFQVYSTFLGSMKKGMYLIAGEAINYIPIVSEAQVIDEVVEYSEPQEEVSVPETENESTVDVQEADSIEEAPEEQIETDEEISSEEEGEIIDISIDEDDSDDAPSQEEILASIDEKSDSAIASISESYEEPSDLDLFDNNEENTQDEETPADEVIAPMEEIEDEEAVVSADEDETPGSDDTLQELELVDEPENTEEIPEEYIEENLEELAEAGDETEDSAEDDLSADLAEINEASVSIGELSEEELSIDTSEVSQDIPTDELSEDMLEELPSEEDLGIEENIPEQLEGDSDELEAIDEEMLDEPEETTIELDGDADILLDAQEEPQETEEYPQNTNLDVDFTEPKIMPMTGEALNHDFDEIVELDSSEAAEDDIIVDMSNDEQIGIDEDREQEILEEVDKVYTTMKEEPDGLEEISDSDLDLIDSLNSDGDELQEYHSDLEEAHGSDDGILEEVHPEPKQAQNDADEILEHKESSTPIVPLYDADIPQEDMVMSDPIQQGDAVLHAKYGNGVVEKMIKYGTKTLYAINFENIGRRLLDPTLTEIKRV